MVNIREPKTNFSFYCNIAEELIPKGYMYVWYRNDYSENNPFEFRCSFYGTKSSSKRPTDVYDLKFTCTPELIDILTRIKG